MSYGSGAFSGEEWLDNVTLTSDLVISQQSIGVASWVEGLNGVDGILGLGPIDLTQNTVSNVFEVPTIPDNLFTQKKTSQEVLGVFFLPSSESDNSGTLTFGGYDDSVTTSPVNYVPLTTTDPAAYYWGINESISYGNTSILASTAGIVDTGTTLMLIASGEWNIGNGVPQMLTPLSGSYRCLRAILILDRCNSRLYHRPPNHYLRSIHQLADLVVQHRRYILWPHTKCSNLASFAEHCHRRKIQCNLPHRQ